MTKETNADDAIILEMEAREGERALRAVHAFLGRFVCYPSAHAHDAHALWCVHAHLMDKWESTPRLAALSAEPSSGKTRLLEATETLVPNPVSAVNVSPAYLFRKVGCEGGATILFDEIDTVFGPRAKENEEIRGLLNAGHRRGAVAGRCVVHGKTVTTEEIPAYAAVALAGLGWLPDTLMSRSVIIRMRRRHSGEHVEPFRHRIHGPEGEAVKHLIERWARTATVTWPTLPPEIQDRDADIWEPLIAVADAVGSDWPGRARVAAVALVAAAKETEPSLGIRLLTDIKTVFDTDELPSKELLRRLINIEESPWGNLKGNPLDERGLARRLRQYSIKSCNICIGETRPKGYRRADFMDAWSRYLPPSDNSATSATAARGRVSSDHSRGHVALVAQVADLPEHGGAAPGVSNGHQCWQCGEHGEVQQCGYGEVEPWLHQSCVDAWMASHQTGNADGLDIPDFLDRTKGRQ